MKSVMHVITGLGTGGAEANLVRLARMLQARGSVQHVVSMTGRGAFADDLEGAGVAVTDLAILSPRQGLRGIRDLVGLINNVRPDILQGWMYHGNLAALGAHVLARRRRGRRLFWNLRASNMDEGRYGRILRLSSMFSSFPEGVVSNSAAGFAFHEARGFRARRSVLIPNGIDTESYRPDLQSRLRMRDELGIPHEAVVAIMVARVDPMKDHDSFLSAMSQNPGITAILAGEGTRDLKLGANILALGRRSDVDRLYAAADIIVAPSAFGEGFSNAIAEGMASGLVPIATDVGDARLIVGETGHIVAPRDVDSLAQEIAAVANLPSSERAARGKAARDRIVQHFGLARSIDAYAELYGL